MAYDVRFVEDEKLPPGHDWLLLRDGDCACVFIRRSIEERCGRRCGGCSILARADAAYRKMMLPQPRTATA